MLIYIILSSIPCIMLIWQLLLYLFTFSFDFNKVIIKIVEVISVIIYPVLFITLIEQPTNDCCGESATFSPNHRFSIYTLILFCQLAYFISSYKKEILSPVGEVSVNCLLILGLTLNIFISFHIEAILSFIGSMPIIILFLFQLLKNHRLFLETNEMLSTTEFNAVEKLMIKVLSYKGLLKFSMLSLICIPLLVIIICILLLFSQKPDAFVKAFTETYKHGFSKWDHQCENVLCGGHYLCSVAANGHPSIVKPIRYGARNGKIIICNRQLLIANAFEDWLQETFPILHKNIRYQYNKIGNMIHRYYYVFEVKFFSDVIYLLMKPMEFCFLFVLYTFDKSPENRIAMQYITREI